LSDDATVTDIKETHMTNDHERKLLTRRDVLKLAGVGASGLVLRPAPALASGGVVAENAAAALYDATMCVGCRACEAACKEWNMLPPEPEPPSDTTANTWTLIKQYRDGPVESFCKYQCMHCEHPACVSACPVSALEKLPDGPVVYDAKKCIGCRYCMVVCPFHIPKVHWDRVLPEIKKCTFCADRQAQALEPACIAACPTGALAFGRREDLIAEAESRIRSQPDKYVDHIYGKDEAGGTSWMYISSVPLEELGLPTLGSEPIPELSEKVAVYGTPSVGVGMAALLGGVYWFTKRRAEQMAQSGVQGEEEASDVSNDQN
jgi:formate dehydrogenase iron-sulfur subunit